MNILPSRFRFKPARKPIILDERPRTVPNFLKGSSSSIVCAVCSPGFLWRQTVRALGISTSFRDTIDLGHLAIPGGFSSTFLWRFDCRNPTYGSHHEIRFPGRVPQQKYGQHTHSTTNNAGRSPDLDNTLDSPSQSDPSVLVPIPPLCLLLFPDIPGSSPSPIALNLLL